MNASTFWALALLVVLHLVILFLIIRIISRFVKKFVSGEIRYRTEKVLAMGLVAWLFPKTLTAAIMIPVQRVLYNLQRLFYVSYDYVSAAATEDRQKLDILAKDSPINEKLVSVADLLQEFVLSDFIIAFACLIIFYHILRLIKPRYNAPLIGAGVKTGDKRILVFNILIGLSLTLSIYFVISVFVSIPYLNEMKKPSGYSKATLDSTLNNMAKGVIGLKTFTPTAMPAGLKMDSILYTEALKARYEALPVTIKTALTAQVNSIDVQYQKTVNDRSLALQEIAGASKDDAAKNSSFIKKLGTMFEMNSSDISTDKGMLYNDLVGGFDSYLNLKQRNYTEITNYLQLADGSNKNAISTEIQRIRAYIGAQNPDTTVFEQQGGFYPRVYFSSYTDIHFNNYDNYINSVNTRQKNGSDWGMLGNMSHYLIVTKSQELILLIGMIGFGILGASILSFVPTDDFFKTCTQEPIIKNFPNVLARGFGAALVIYLATKGGLAIFSGGNTADPNGYILLLTCFVGAVYSEKVWSRVSVSLLSTAKPEEKTKTGKAAALPAEAPKPVSAKKPAVAKKPKPDSDKPKPGE